MGVIKVYAKGYCKASRNIIFRRAKISKFDFYHIREYINTTSVLFRRDLLNQRLTEN